MTKVSSATYIAYSTAAAAAAAIQTAGQARSAVICLRKELQKNSFDDDHRHGRSGATQGGNEEALSKQLQQQQQQQQQQGSGCRVLWLLALVILMLANDIRIARRVSSSGGVGGSNRRSEPIKDVGTEQRLFLVDRWSSPRTTTKDNTSRLVVEEEKNYRQRRHLLTSGYGLAVEEEEEDMHAHGEKRSNNDDGEQQPRFNVILNYRVEARVVGIQDYGPTREHISGFSERFVDLAIDEERSGNTGLIEIQDVSTHDDHHHQYAQLTIRSSKRTTTAPRTAAAAMICDYQYSLGLPMRRSDGGGGLFGTTSQFKNVATCSYDGMTYTILLQVAVMENQPHRTETGKSYDISFMNHAINHEYGGTVEGAGLWQRAERSDTYQVKNLSAGKMVLDPLEPEHKIITLLEDGPEYVVIEINFDNTDLQCSYQYFMTIAMEETGVGFSNGMEALNPCSNTSPAGDNAFAMLLHAFVVEV